MLDLSRTNIQAAQAIQNKDQSTGAFNIPYPKVNITIISCYNQTDKHISIENTNLLR